jgi:cysteinyl-tRNA synthetase
MRNDEPSWQFMINNKDYAGRPGWHIECSAMSTDLLGQPFDIHTGGIDLIFPHHENEIAQSTAGKVDSIYSKTFFHNEHLLIDKKKMSKSLNNVFTLEDVKERNIDPLAFRLLILQSHYRSQANFSWDILNAANNRLKDLRNFAALRHQTIKESGKEMDLANVTNKIKGAILNDLNTPLALAELSNIQAQIQEELISVDQIEYFNNFLNFIDEILGLNLIGVEDINDNQKGLLKSRQEARDNHNWSLSDEIRDKLLNTGLSVRDSGHGQIWTRTYSVSSLR